MNNKNLIPQQAKPINRITIGQLPRELAELSEEVLGTVENGFQASMGFDCVNPLCSFDGDDAAVEPSEYCLSPPMQQFCSFDGDEPE